MSISFTAAVPKVWVKFSHNGNTDVIYHAKYEITGTKSDRTFTSSEGLNLDISSISNFIAYSSVTQATVASWIEAQHATRVAEIKQSIEDHIDEQLSPTQEMRTLAS